MLVTRQFPADNPGFADNRLRCTTKSAGIFFDSFTIGNKKTPGNIRKRAIFARLLLESINFLREMVKNATKRGCEALLI